MTAQTNPELEQQIPELVADLRDVDALKRQRARLLLVDRAQDSIPALLEALKSQNVHVRWEAVQALGEIQAPETANALCDMLVDIDIGVRWAAMESLIRLGRHSLRPVMESFIKNFDSPWLREGVHHILHVLKDRNELNDREITLFQELDKQSIPGFESNWTSEQAWAAEKALELLDQEAWKLKEKR
jgi:HEAT repeat protein